MSLFKHFVFLASLLCLSIGSSNGIGPNDVLDIIKIAKDVALVLAKAWNIVDPHVDFSEVPLPLIDKTESKLFGKIAVITGKLDQLADNVESVGEVFLTELNNNKSLEHKRKIQESYRPILINFYNFMNDVNLRIINAEIYDKELRLNDLQDYITRTNVIYRHFRNYADKQQEYEQLTLKDFAKYAVSHDSSSVASLLERIHAFVQPTARSLDGGNDQGLLGSLGKSLEEVEGDMICDTKQSPQQVLYNLYSTITLTELKGYSMIQFSYMLLRLYGEGETYEEVTQLLQGYVQNEVDLNPEGTCRENCAEYTYTKSHGCYKNLFCQQQRRCNGKIINCHFYDADMWICPADPSSGRRYEYIEYENGRVLGRKQVCTRGTTKVDSWWRWLFWHCSYCFCYCDEQGPNSDRYFNMRPVLANVENNSVVTGLRFVKHNRIIHIQIQEGKLQPRGNIDPDSVKWKPVEDYKITDKNIQSGKDYHTMSWEKRAFDLDDLEGDEGYILTGVRFKEIGSHLNFEIYLTKFDFEKGKLVPQSSIWKDNPNTDSSIKNPRTKVRLNRPDVPIRSTAPSIPDSFTDQYIEFTNTDIDKDVAQTTVPFLDAQKVESFRPVPLSGAGVFHKGRDHFGGFVAPKLITYDFSKHLKAAFPEEQTPYKIQKK
nr:unnamed protein product [Callosobruchus chinensis]